VDKDLLLINRQDFERLSELQTMCECVIQSYMQVIKHGEYEEEDLMRLVDSIDFLRHCLDDIEEYGDRLIEKDDGGN